MEYEEEVLTHDKEDCIVLSVECESGRSNRSIRTADTHTFQSSKNKCTLTIVTFFTLESALDTGTYLRCNKLNSEPASKTQGRRTLDWPIKLGSDWLSDFTSRSCLQHKHQEYSRNLMRFSLICTASLGQGLCEFALLILLSKQVRSQLTRQLDTETGLQFFHTVDSRLSGP